jgi:predicted ATPase
VGPARSFFSSSESDGQTPWLSFSLEGAIMVPEKIVVTGGPSTGKTTVINMIEQQTGLAVAQEEARILINAGHFDLNAQWEEFQLELVTRQMNAEERLAAQGKPFLCDRGIFDSVAYSVKKGRMPKFLLELATPRYALAFLMEPLGFFINDGTRTEDLKFTEAITPLLETAYSERGVTVCRVPSATPQERVDFMLAKVHELTGINIPLLR